MSFYSFLLYFIPLLCFAQGNPSMICTEDLTVPKISRYNEIDCKFTAIQQVKSCKNPKKCVPSNTGAIALKNCRPDENETITTMLMSFQRPGESKQLIITEDIAHLVIRVFESYQSKGIELNETMFEGLSINFPNLKSITFQYEGIVGSVTNQTFKGLENIETIRFVDTYMESVEIGSFKSLKKLTGISLEKNVLLKNLPSRIFENVATLKRLRIVEPLETVIENLSLQLENLEELRIVGSAYYKPTLPTRFLHTSCDKLVCIDLKYVNPNLSNTLFSKCHQFKYVNLQTNNFSFDQIMDIEEQVLSPLNNLSYLKIEEKSLECPVLLNMTCSNCTMAKKFNNLFQSAKHTDVQCRKNGLRLSNNYENNVMETKKIFSEFLEKCESCNEIEGKSLLILSISVSAGLVVTVLVIIIAALKCQDRKSSPYQNMALMAHGGKDSSKMETGSLSTSSEIIMPS